MSLPSLISPPSIDGLEQVRLQEPEQRRLRALAQALVRARLLELELVALAWEPVALVPVQLVRVRVPLEPVLEWARPPT